MLCPYCGNDTAARSGRCGVCSADLSAAPTQFGEDHAATPDSLDTVGASADEMETRCDPGLFTTGC